MEIIEPQLTARPDRELAPLWRSVAGKLLVQTCRVCAHCFFYPRSHCPACLSDDLAWTECAGTGRIYSFSIVCRGAPVPYAIAYVTLDEGPMLMTNIVETDLDTIEIGQPVQVAFMEVDGIPAPMFQPKRNVRLQRNAIEESADLVRMSLGVGQQQPHVHCQTKLR